MDGENNSPRQMSHSATAETKYISLWDYKDI